MAERKDNEMLDRLSNDNYTTAEVSQAVGRKKEHWCRIRHKYITKYKLQVVKVGRKHYYKKDLVNKMIEQLLQDGD